MHILKPITLTPALFTANNVPVNDFAAWNSATSYTVGTKVIRTTTNKIYRNLIAGINATLPENDPTRWFDEGYVNAYKLIDSQSSTQTANTAFVSFTVDVNQSISSIAFINLVGQELTITATNGGAEGIYNKVISLESTSITSIYEWFFEPFVQKTDHVEIDFPETYTDPIITFTVSATSGQAKIGRFACAKAYEIGQLQYGAGIGIKDYSVKFTDANNIVSLTKKDNVKMLLFKLIIGNDETNRISKLLRELLSIPCIFIGHSAEGYEYTIAHGFYQNFRVILQLPTVNYCELEVEELI